VKEKVGQEKAGVAGASSSFAFSGDAAVSSFFSVLPKVGKESLAAEKEEVQAGLADVPVGVVFVVIVVVVASGVVVVLAADAVSVVAAVLGRKWKSGHLGTSAVPALN